MFTTDSRTANFLTGLGIEHVYRNGLRIPEELAKGWELRNIGRPKPVREDAVAQYAALMEAGSAAPAPILVETENGFDVLDGVQRISASLSRNETVISAYVVTTDAAILLTMVRVLANPKIQGVSEPAEWSKKRAVEALAVDNKMSYTEVAAHGGWRVADVKRIAESIEMQRRVYHVGGPELTEAMLIALKPHMPVQSHLEAAAKPIVGFFHTLKKSKISAADSKIYIETFFEPLPNGSNPYKTYEKRLAAVHEDAEMSVRVTGRQATELPKDVVLLRTLRTAEKQLTHIITHGEEVQNIPEYCRIVNNIKAGLTSIQAKRRKCK